MKYCYLLLILILFSCQSENNEADIIIQNAVVYSATDIPIKADAVAIKNGRISAIGFQADIKPTIGQHTEIIDAKGQFLMPGLIEGHGHFIGFGKSLMELNFLKSENWDTILSQVKTQAQITKPGDWIVGRGWHQEKWNKTPEPSLLGYPFHDELSDVTPDHPVILVHASAHSLFANKKAMELAGLNPDTPNPDGGLIVKDHNDKILGVFEENAMQIIAQAYNNYEEQLNQSDLDAYWLKAVELAQTECIKNGITSFQDAGTSYDDIQKYKSLIKKDSLFIRLWVMLRHSYADMKNNMDGLPIIDAGDHHLTCRAIKTEVDGALGSYGAWLLQPYHDKPGFIGQNTTTISEVDSIAGLAIKHNMQLCVHAIGDRANREVLDIFEQHKAFNKRWRIEHAQHLHPDDIERFNSLGAIASMQAIHCTSDAPFVEKRLGIDRARDGAYAWRSIIDSGGRMANGTDAPVENISPLENIYASVTRKRTDMALEFFPEQKMTRDEALKSYTIWNAYAAHEEKDKGTIEVGKLADLILLSNNLLTCDEKTILKTEVKLVMIGGQVLNFLKSDRG